MSDPERFRPILAACLAGEREPAMAFMHLLMEASEAGEAETVLAIAEARDEAGRERLAELRRLARENPNAFAAVRGVLDAGSHDGDPSLGRDAALARWAALFDRAAAASPEASVALYSLGDPERLRAATAEVVAEMGRRGLIGADTNVLEIGCGIGRFLQALAPAVASAAGIDISPVMVETARTRCAGLPNVSVALSEGRDLSMFAGECCDLVLAADSFPYIVGIDLDLARTHVAEAARVLRSGGVLLVLNFSYRGDRSRDREDFARLASEAGLRVRASGEKPFRLWDGTLFEASKP